MLSNGVKLYLVQFIQELVIFVHPIDLLSQFFNPSRELTFAVFDISHKLCRKSIMWKKLACHFTHHSHLLTKTMFSTTCLRMASSNSGARQQSVALHRQTDREKARQKHNGGHRLKFTAIFLQSAIDERVCYIRVTCWKYNNLICPLTDPTIMVSK